MSHVSVVASRRKFITKSFRVAATSALVGVAIPNVHAGENNTIHLALIGCGSRGSGAVADALSVKNGPTKLTAMADVYQERLDGSHANLLKCCGKSIDVPEDRRFVGLDAYKKAVDCLKPGDVAIMATPPAFRWAHFGYAVEKGVHVFMEKPLSVDAPTTHKIIKIAEQAAKKNLKVGVGLMIRHCKARLELQRRLQDGQLGDLLTFRIYRMQGTGCGFNEPKPKDISELDFQIRNFHSFLWASGGIYSDFYIHQIDECCWMKNAWPIQAHGNSGRHYRGNRIDQNFDHYSVEYTFADGAKMFLNGRCYSGCYEDFSSFVHGTKGAAVITTSGHMPGKCRIYKGQNIGNKEGLLWEYPSPEPNPYQLEWKDLIEAVRRDRPYNEAKRGAAASLVTSMGRMAAHTGRIVTWKEMLCNQHEFAPHLDQLTSNSPAPLMPGGDGKYSIPQPGIVTDREF